MGLQSTAEEGPLPEAGQPMDRPLPNSGEAGGGGLPVAASDQREESGAAQRPPGPVPRGGFCADIRDHRVSHAGGPGPPGPHPSPLPGEDAGGSGAWALPGPYPQPPRGAGSPASLARGSRVSSRPRSAGTQAPEAAGALQRLCGVLSGGELVRSETLVREGKNAPWSHWK